MPRIITPPDLEFDNSIPKVLIRNCTWTDDQIREYLLQLSDKNYDIYLYDVSKNDEQWFEGVRSMAVKVLDCKHYKDQDPNIWLKELDDTFEQWSVKTE